jgi:hypothetical protein
MFLLRAVIAPSHPDKRISMAWPSSASNTCQPGSNGTQVFACSVPGFPRLAIRNSKGQFQLGHSGGRPKGARNRLAAQVFEDILRHWCEPAAPGSKLCKGAEALETLYKDKPGEYLA